MDGWARLLPLCLVAAALPLAPPASATDANVDVGNFFFDPSSVAVGAGETVTWIWVGGTHSVLEDGTNAVWCATQSGGSCQRTFAAQGTYSYHCGVHPASMSAAVVVGTPPSVAVASPANGASVSGVVSVTGTSSHADGIDRVEVRFDGDEAIVASGTGAWNAGLDSAPLTNGAHTLTATAFAATGTSASATISVTVANPATFDLDVVTVTGATGLLGSTSIGVTLRNAGNTGVSSEADFEYFYKGQWAVLGTQPFGVDGKATITITQAWSSPTKVGKFEVRVTLDPDDEVPELDEGNNQGTGFASFWTNQVSGVDAADP